MLDQIFTTITGSIFFGIVVPIVYLALMKAAPFQHIYGIYLLIAIGVVMGIILGFIFPKLARWILEIFLGV